MTRGEGRSATAAGALRGIDSLDRVIFQVGPDLDDLIVGLFFLVVLRLLAVGILLRFLKGLALVLGLRARLSWRLVHGSSSFPQVGRCGKMHAQPSANR